MEKDDSVLMTFYLLTPPPTGDQRHIATPLPVGAELSFRGTSQSVTNRKRICTFKLSRAPWNGADNTATRAGQHPHHVLDSERLVVNRAHTSQP